MMDTRGKGMGGVKDKGGQLYGDRRRLDFGCGHTVQRMDDVS